MKGCFPTIHWYDHWDVRQGAIALAGEVEHAETLNGDDVLAFACRCGVEKGDRLVWRDGGYGWREHVVTRVSEGLDGLAHVRAEGSLCELSGDYLERVYVGKAGVLQAFETALAVTRWGVEVIGDVGGEVNCWLYHTDALSTLRRLADTFEVDVEPRVEVGPRGVVRRYVVVSPRMGGLARGALRLRSQPGRVQAHRVGVARLHGPVRVRRRLARC